jgi:glycosyltransferase involved in cell wall biosynthesis
MNLKNKIKIATILPYKENYSKKNASAASLWVSEYFKRSIFKDFNNIYGNTNSKDYLTKNYINIELKSINSKFRSTTTEYADKLINRCKIENYDLIEIHNRPLLLSKLKNKINSKFIFYYHNDPLSMNGSKKIDERLNLLNQVEKIVFVSSWVQKRFFLNIDKKLISKTIVIYPSVNKQKKIKKNKNIVFVGKLNYAKGYDLFNEAITKILNKFKDWKAYSVGNEERRSIFINHKSHKELGFLNHKKTIEFFNKSEIAVVPSRWDEPFGRSALEATSCGCATITSSKGGLHETSDYTIKLKYLNSINLFKAIKKLIENNKYRNNIQNLSRKNVKHLISNNTKLIDNVRTNCFQSLKINFLKNKIKILNLYNQGQKLNHRLYNISLGKKFTNGFIRNGYDVLEVSDRDFVKNNKYNDLFQSRKKFQNYLIETFKNYKPNILFFGHSTNLDLSTLDELKVINKNLVISQWNEDPIMPDLYYSKQNIDNIKLYSEFVDHNFITTHPSVIEKHYDMKNFHFFFVPVDKNIECYEVYKMNPQNDLFYAMSHGVNRAILKDGVEDNRVLFLDNLIKKISNIKYDFYGFSNKQPIWGHNFNLALTNSKMGLNLSRGKPTKYYSSNRIASIMGNGLLTFIDRKVGFQDFFNNKEMIFYNNVSDLAEKIIYYANKDTLIKKIAAAGKKKYFKIFNEKKITKYFVDISIGKKSNII